MGSKMFVGFYDVNIRYGECSLASGSRYGAGNSRGWVSVGDMQSEVRDMQSAVRRMQSEQYQMQSQVMGMQPEVRIMHSRHLHIVLLYNENAIRSHIYAIRSHGNATLQINVCIPVTGMQV